MRALIQYNANDKLDGRDLSLVHKEIKSLGNVVSKPLATQWTLLAQVHCIFFAIGLFVYLTAGVQPKLCNDILNTHYNSLDYERRHLSTMYYQLARLGYFSSADG